MVLSLTLSSARIKIFRRARAPGPSGTVEEVILRKEKDREGAISFPLQFVRQSLEQFLCLRVFFSLIRPRGSSLLVQWKQGRKFSPFLSASVAVAALRRHMGA